MNTLGLTLAVGGGMLAVSPLLADSHGEIKLLCLALGALALWVDILCRRQAVGGTPLGGVIGFFWLSMFASTLVSVEPHYSIYGIYLAQFYGLMPLAVVTLLYYASAYASFKRDDLVDTIILVSIPLSLYAWVQSAGFDAPWPIHNGRSTSTSGSPVYLGAYLIIILPLILYRWGTLQAYVAGVAGAGALFLTFSRGAWISAAISAAGYFIAARHVTLTRRRVVGAILLGALIAMVGIRHNSHWEGDSLRVEMWKIAVEAFKHHPVLGTGPETFALDFRKYRTDGAVAVIGTTRIQGSAHNDLFQIAATQGTIGVIVYLLLSGGMFALTINLCWRGGREDRPFNACVFSALTGLWVQAKFNPVPITAMAVLALLVGAAMRWYDKGGREEGYASGRGGVLLALCCSGFLIRDVYADFVFKRATNYLTAGNAVSAGEDFQRALRLLPTRTQYHRQYSMFLGDAYEIADVASRKKILQHAVQLGWDSATRCPGEPLAWEMFGVALMANGQNNQAKDVFHIAQMLDPKFLPTLKIRMDLAQRMGDENTFIGVGNEYVRLSAIERTLMAGGTSPARHTASGARQPGGRRLSPAKKRG